MFRRLGNRLRIGDFDEFAQIHHPDTVGNVGDDGEIMRDEEIGKIELFLELLEQIEHLSLDGDIQGRNRFVADDEFGIERQRAGNADALPLAA